jgi:uncharacterized repeat protein (TIGR01451 family)
MMRIRGIAGIAVLGAALAGWVNPVGAQSNPVKLPPTENGTEPALTPQAGPQNYGQSGAVPGLAAPAGNGAQMQGSPYGQPPAQAYNPQLPANYGAQPASQYNQQPAPQQNSQQPAAAPNAQGADDLGPGQQPDNPTGRQEPAMSIEWIGPPQAKVGRPSDYTIAVRNVGNIVVQQVMVRVRMPAGMSVTAMEPKAFTEGNVLMWELGTMSPKQDKNLQLRVVPDTKGMEGCQAWVTFTGSSSMHVRVSEPKLMIKAAAPERVMVGDAATFALTVSNPGDGPAELVKIHAALSDGLEHPRGKNVDFDIGNLAPGESRSVQLICGTKTGGVQTCECVAEADGDLHAQDRAAMNVIMPRLDLEVAGPKLRYLDRKAVYTFKVTNPGDAPASNVSVSDVIPQGFKFAQASDSGRHDFSTRTVSWFLGEIGPGQAREVKLEVVAVNPGEHHHHVAAQAARGLKVENDIMTRVEGLSAIMLEVVDTEDPIEVGADTAYEIRITNTGSKTETDIKLVCVVPDKMQFKSAQGPTRFHEQGKEIVFEALPKLAPRADAIFRVNVKGVTPGDVRFRAQITSTNLQEPVVEMESTRIYED